LQGVHRIDRLRPLQRRHVKDKIERYAGVLLRLLDAIWAQLRGRLRAHPGAWWANVAVVWPQLDPWRYDARFQRLWRYYQQTFMGYFRARRGQLVLSRPTRNRI
jgi:hypothetical protein